MKRKRDNAQVSHERITSPITGNEWDLTFRLHRGAEYVWMSEARKLSGPERIREAAQALVEALDGYAPADSFWGNPGLGRWKAAMADMRAALAQNPLDGDRE